MFKISRRLLLFATKSGKNEKILVTKTQVVVLVAVQHFTKSGLESEPEKNGKCLGSSIRRRRLRPRFERAQSRSRTTAASGVRWPARRPCRSPSAWGAGSRTCRGGRSCRRPRIKKMTTMKDGMLQMVGVAGSVRASRPDDPGSSLNGALSRWTSQVRSHKRQNDWTKPAGPK